MRRVPEDVVLRVRKLWQAGMSGPRIAKVTHVASATVYALCADIERPKPNSVRFSSPRVAIGATWIGDDQ
jgi:hypothetical protein